MGPMFKAKAVLEALGIKHGTLSSWGYRDRLKKLGAAATTSGKARRFTVDDVARLALFKRLRDAGLPAEQSLEWAALCVSYMNVGAIDEFSICTSVDGEISLLLNEPVAPGTATKITIYPGVILAALKARLGVAADQDDASDEEAEA
jgi:hypothetical protein